LEQIKAIAKNKKLPFKAHLLTPEVKNTSGLTSLVKAILHHAKNLDGALKGSNSTCKYFYS
jgi:antitoxin component of RelBE/YafQ-DinJ toxin-antitoxin module